MLILSSPRFASHAPPPGHPERPERAHVFDVVARKRLARGDRTAELRPASFDDLARVHGRQYLERITATRGRAVMLDPDTYTSPESVEVAELAAGSALQAAEHAFAHREPAAALVRPPGHHAERERAMGFCLFNNVAVAAAAMLARSVERIAIVDIDVHHGNGTQEMFYGEPRVLYVSSHQYPFYPGTGAAEEIGAGDGRGFTVNIPMEAGSTDADYAVVYRTIVMPILEEFAPQLLLVSAGFDAHERDPLASMRMTTEGYRAIVGALGAVRSSNGAIALVTEGGYELTALAACQEASFEALDAPAARRATDAASNAARDGARGERAADRVRAALKPYWPRL